jgi:hypothetical protein
MYTGRLPQRCHQTNEEPFRKHLDRNSRLERFQRVRTTNNLSISRKWYAKEDDLLRTRRQEDTDDEIGRRITRESIEVLFITENNRDE